MPTRSPASEALKDLRNRAGMTVRAMADAIGRPPSTYASYEDKYKKPFLPLDLVQKIAPVLEARGIPPEEVYALAGVQPGMTGGTETANPLQSERPLADTIEEIDVRGGMGGGGEALLEVDHRNGYSRDAASGEWSIPSAYLQGELRVNASRVKIIPVVGDSMSPTLESGDRVMVNTTDRRPSPPGVFAIWDGFGVVVKRLEVIPNSDPPTIRLLSDNSRHSAYERTADEVNILGRVVWVARRL